MPTLHVHLYRPWFDAIALGYKKNEYRSVTPYWKTRIEGREYDTVQLRNGYCPTDPTLIAEYRGYDKVDMGGQEYYRLKLGAIQELRNYALPALAELPAPGGCMDVNACVDPKQHQHYMAYCDKTQCWLPKGTAAVPEPDSGEAPEIRDIATSHDSSETEDDGNWGHVVGRIVL